MEISPMSIKPYKLIQEDTIPPNLKYHLIADNNTDIQEDQVVGLVIVDKPRPTGVTPWKLSSVSSTSKGAAKNDHQIQAKLIGLGISVVPI